MSKNLLQDMVKVKYVKNKAFKPRSALGGLTAKSHSVGKPRYTLWFVAVVSFLFFLFALSYLFSKSVVTIHPKIKNVILNENLSASKNKNNEKLPFDLIVISGEENKIVKTTGTKDVLEKAQGVVLIYNSFSSATQRLDIDTRLEGSNGKIYKTKNQVIVPGMKGNTPGSVEVGIYGVEAGETYNSGPLDFTIFGFKGTPKYSKFYARSKGEITGGFKGNTSVISDVDKLATINDLKTTLQAKLFKKAKDQIPNGFILFKDAIFLNIDENSINPVFSKDNMSDVKIKGTLYGLLFDIEKLTKKIIENSIKEDDGSIVYLPNIQDLTFSLLAQTGLSDKDNVSFKDVKDINFNLSGATKIVWKLDESKLRTDLLGKAKKDFNQILLQYPNIDLAESVISPFWRMSFPDKIKDIKIIVNYPK